MSWFKRDPQPPVTPKQEAWYQKIVDRVPNDHRDEWSEEEQQIGGEDYYYCGECKGYLPISSFPHPHKK